MELIFAYKEQQKVGLKRKNKARWRYPQAGSVLCKDIRVVDKAS